MLRTWLLWTMLLALTCGAVAGCSGPDGKPSSDKITDEGKK